MLKATKTVRFDAAHILTNHQGLCKNLHGHTYRVDVSVAQTDDSGGDMVIDFKDLEILEEEKLVERKADLRAFVVSGKETKVWSSGLTRFSRNPDSFVVNSSQGGGFKDTWIMEE